MKKIHSVKISLFFILSLFLFDINESSAVSVCENPTPGTFLYDDCPVVTPIDCTTIGGVNALCPVAPGWDCSAPSCPATCDFGGPGCAGTNCVNEFEACGCSCGGVVAPPSSGGLAAGCAGGAPGDNDGDGDPCDPGETMFNCTPDCLPPGIPTKSITDVLDDIILWILGFGIMIAITFLVWGGINYVASAGDATKTENSKKIVKYSILGMLVIGLSYAAITMLDIIFS